MKRRVGQSMVQKSRSAPDKREGIWKEERRSRREREGVEAARPLKANWPLSNRYRGFPVVREGCLKSAAPFPSKEHLNSRATGRGSPKEDHVHLVFRDLAYVGRDSPSRQDLWLLLTER